MIQAKNVLKILFRNGALLAWSRISLINTFTKDKKNILKKVALTTPPFSLPKSKKSHVEKLRN